jgi:hypothetical protein
MIRTLALSLFVGYTTTLLRRTSGLVLTVYPETIRQCIFRGRNGCGLETVDVGGSWRSIMMRVNWCRKTTVQHSSGLFGSRLK